ncbi:MAG: hypothetical protein Q4G69_09025, partial [Planctomycetia bacterium]|nr:hypothetical protein [Planctomycetia bacterium]
MDTVKKYYFWAVVPIMVLVAFFVSSSAQNAIRAKFEEKKKAVEAEKNSMDSIAGNNLHPNDQTIEAIRGETNILKKSVFEAWTLMYNDQKMRNRWPRKLSREFLNLVEKMKFRAPIDPTRPYLREDYSFFIGNHLPALLKQVKRHRCQVQDYKYVKNDQDPSKSRFYPVYVDEESGETEETRTYYILITEPESDKVKDVMIYDIKRELLTKVQESAKRDELISKKRVPYFREMDPWITAPKDHMSFGLGSASVAGGGGMSGGDMGGAPRGSMGDEPGGMMGGNLAQAVPGDGIDPALLQLDNAASSGGGMGEGAPSPGMMGGMAGSNEPTHPGLPPYVERRRIVGNVDWSSPEIYALPTWSQGGYPTSIEIWYAQESLWVYEALLRVIAETNKEFPDNITTAPIKAIESLLIGQPAGTLWQTTIGAINLMPSQGGMGEGDMMGSMEMSGGPMDGETGEGGPASGALTENDILMKILFGRYLDGENKPLPAETAPPFAEFNKMPVCMKLVVDQRRIPELLVNCANCSMPIDIKHIRISPENVVRVSGPSAGGAEGADGMGGAPGGASGGPGGARGSMEGGGMDGGTPTGGIEVGRSAISQVAGYGVDAIHIEVYGIINIFNEPNIADFGTGQDSTNADTKMTEDTLNAPSAKEAKAGSQTGDNANPENPANPDASESTENPEASGNVPAGEMPSEPGTAPAPAPGTAP